LTGLVRSSAKKYSLRASFFQLYNLGPSDLVDAPNMQQFLDSHTISRLPSDAQVRSRAALVSLSRVLPMDVAEAVSREMWDLPIDRFRCTLRSDAVRRAVLEASLDLGVLCGPAHQEVMMRLAGIVMTDALAMALTQTDANPGNADRVWAAMVDGCSVGFCRAIGAAAEHVPELQDPTVTDYAALRSRDRVPPEDPSRPQPHAGRVLLIDLPLPALSF
jgi:hypothetical protein